MSLRRILGNRWHEYMSNDLVLREVGLRQVTCIRECQLSLDWHVARLPAEDPDHRDPRCWTLPKGRSHASCLRQVESCLKDTCVVGLALSGRWLDGGQGSTVAR